jgi:hypothetical protein
MGCPTGTWVLCGFSPLGTSKRTLVVDSGVWPQEARFTTGYEEQPRPCPRTRVNAKVCRGRMLAGAVEKRGGFYVEQQTLPGVDPIDLLTREARRFAVIRASFPEIRKYSNKWCAWKARGGEEARRRPNHSDEELGSRWYNNQHVKKHIAKIRAEQEGIVFYDGIEVLRDALRLKEMAFGDLPVRLVRFRTRTIGRGDDAEKHVEALEMEVRQTDLSVAKGILELLAKHFRLLDRGDRDGAEEDDGVSITLNLAGK